MSRANGRRESYAAWRSRPARAPPWEYVGQRRVRPVPPPPQARGRAASTRQRTSQRRHQSSSGPALGACGPTRAARPPAGRRKSHPRHPKSPPRPWGVGQAHDPRRVSRAVWLSPVGGGGAARRSLPSCPAAAPPARTPRGGPSRRRGGPPSRPNMHKRSGGGSLVHLHHVTTRGHPSAPACKRVVLWPSGAHGGPGESVLAGELRQPQAVAVGSSPGAPLPPHPPPPLCPLLRRPPRPPPRCRPSRSPTTANAPPPFGRLPLPAPRWPTSS